MDRDIALDLVTVMTDIKTAIQTIANGGTPPEAAANASVSETRNLETPVEEPAVEEPAVEPVTRATTKNTTKRG